MVLPECPVEGRKLLEPCLERDRRNRHLRCGQKLLCPVTTYCVDVTYETPPRQLPAHVGKLSLAQVGRPCRPGKALLLVIPAPDVLQHVPYPLHALLCLRPLGSFSACLAHPVQFQQYERQALLDGKTVFRRLRNLFVEHSPQHPSYLLGVMSGDWARLGSVQELLRHPACCLGYCTREIHHKNSHRLTWRINQLVQPTSRHGYRRIRSNRPACPLYDALPASSHHVHQAVRAMAVGPRVARPLQPALNPDTVCRQLLRWSY